jgi:hypothetical protein
VTYLSLTLSSRDCQVVLEIEGTAVRVEITEKAGDRSLVGQIEQYRGINSSLSRCVDENDDRDLWQQRREGTFDLTQGYQNDGQALPRLRAVFLKGGWLLVSQIEVSDGQFSSSKYSCKTHPN